MLKFLIYTIALFLVSGCATVGTPFEYKGPDSVVKGKTTKAQVLAMYGDPFRVGFENGDAKWTYGYYHYRLFGETETKDLDISFDRNGVVSSCTYSSSTPEEVKKEIGNN